MGRLFLITLGLRRRSLGLENLAVPTQATAGTTNVRRDVQAAETPVKKLRNEMKKRARARARRPLVLATAHGQSSFVVFKKRLANVNMHTKYSYEFFQNYYLEFFFFY